MRFIKELREGDRVSEVYLCKSYLTLTAKNGNSYGSVVLQDKTGTIDGKIWKPANPGIDDFASMDYVCITADVKSFQGALQLDISRVRRVDSADYKVADYLPASRYDADEMFREFTAILDTVKEAHLRALLRRFFVEDTEFVRRFRLHSAAKAVHHGFVSGLLEHTLSIIKLCDFYCLRYPILNRDLLLTAAAFHDCGKVYELSCFPENDYTDDGQLLGHIMIGYEKLSQAISEIPDFPAKLATELKHCILAHHGELEYGSPKKPALIEALALSMADNTDAKLEAMTELLESAPDGSWLGFQRLFDSNVRRTSGATER
ncbi:MAG: HD domain-containing protein [Lachnospiraceae bacterium]|nr:HD domain-containing protein [Lachnospiraceae bacterium]MDY5742464.1 HD domain-containing protein [Lachnospiraceae bacterium]